MYLQYECKEPVSLYPALQWWNQPKIGAEWLFGGTGVGASNHFEAGGFIRSREEFAWPNIQYHFLPVAINYNSERARFPVPRRLNALAKPWACAD